MTEFQQRLDDFCRQSAGELPQLAVERPASLEKLLAMLNRLPRGEQSCVLRFLAQLKIRGVIPALLKFLPSATPHLADELAQVIATQGGDQAGPVLLEILDSTNLPVEIRRAVVYALVWLFDPRALSTLLECCRNRREDAVIRTTAAEGLMYLARDLEPGSAPWEEAVQVFLSGLLDPQVEVRYWSVYGVGSLQILAALPTLAHMAQHDVGFDPTRDCWIRDEAREAIRQIESCLHPSLGSRAKSA